jgi:hypothetical protein
MKPRTFSGRELRQRSSAAGGGEVKIVSCTGFGA